MTSERTYCGFTARQLQDMVEESFRDSKPINEVGGFDNVTLKAIILDLIETSEEK